MAASQEFKIRYGGPALSDNTIEVGDLAPALLALRDLISNAYHSEYGEADKISLKIRATEPGSFVVDIFASVTPLIDQMVDFLSGSKATALATILAYLGFVGVTGSSSVASVVQLYKWLAGKKPTKTHQVSTSEIEIFNEKGESLVIGQSVLRLYLSSRTRDEFRRVLQPLEKEGIDDFHVLDAEDQEIVRVSKSEAAFFSNFDEKEQVLTASERDTWVTVKNAWLDGSANKWRFKEGEANWSALIKDNDFLIRMLQPDFGVSASDKMRVTVRQSQYLDGNYVKTEYEILKVHEHLHAAQQIPLNLAPETVINEPSRPRRHLEL